MMKKYLPYIVLLIAAFSVYYIKSHQRGPASVLYPVQTGQQQDATVSPVNDSSNNNSRANNDDRINRSAEHIIYSKHSRCRMDCRHITETEVKEILSTGKINYNKIESDPRGKTYPLEGITQEHQHLRIVFAPKGDDAIEVVTCIDLDTDWPCDCN